VRISGRISDTQLVRESRIHPDVHDVRGLVVAVGVGPSTASASRSNHASMPPCSTSAATRSTRAGVSGCSSPVSLCVKSGKRHSPRALARDAPVGPAFDHAVDALLAPARRPLDLADFLERGPTQPACSMLMNHCGVARKITGVLWRQQCG